VADLSQIQEHADVVDANGNYVGTVDHVDGNRIKLTRQDSPDGQHHYIDANQVESVEDGTVTLSSDYDADSASEFENEEM
jgi:hypothetical protein